MANDSVFLYDPYPPPLFFEGMFDYETHRTWIANNRIYILPVVGLYLLIVFGLQRLMKNRPRIELKKVALVWNLSLAIISLMGSFRFLQYMTQLLQKKGFLYSFCDTQHLHYNKTIAFWYVIFVYSKLIELGDTVLIVLRKHPLIFLHLYHHSMTLSITWFLSKGKVGPARWGFTINYTIHAIMYSYFALCTLGIKPPKWVKISITSAQILQMVVLVLLGGFAFQILKDGRQCELEADNTVAGIVFLLSNLLLFMRFFYTAYIKSDKEKKKKL